MNKHGLYSQLGFEFQKLVFVYNVLGMGSSNQIIYEGCDDVEISSTYFPLFKLYDDSNPNTLIQVKSGNVDVATLKTSPYYIDNSGSEQVMVPVSDIKATAVPSDRYQTVTLSLEPGIKDPNSGIKGYRYELYSTANTTAGNGDLIASKELDTLKSVTFDVDPALSYYGRIVILFDGSFASRYISKESS